MFFSQQRQLKTLFVITDQFYSLFWVKHLTLLSPHVIAACVDGHDALLCPVEV